MDPSPGSESSEHISLSITHQKSTFNLSHIPLNVTLQELCHEHLSNLITLTSRPDQTLFKLILKQPSTTLVSPGPSDQKSLSQLGLSPQDEPHRLLLLTTDVSDVEKTEQATQLKRMREFARLEALKRPVKIRNTTNRQSLTPYRFHELNLLAGLPFESRRQALLEELANHPSIRSQMVKHQFQVGTLGELHPWIDPSILGVNENAGARIRLRLLTDDLKSVRPFSVVRRVLAHELAHNQFGAHDNDFKRLDSDLHRAMLAHDQGVKASSHRLGGELGDHYEPPPAALELHCATTSQSSISSAQTVGSPSNNEAQARSQDPRRAAAEAALRRAHQNK